MFVLHLPGTLYLATLFCVGYRNRIWGWSLKWSVMDPIFLWNEEEMLSTCRDFSFSSVVGLRVWVHVLEILKFHSTEEICLFTLLSHFPQNNNNNNNTKQSLYFMTLDTIHLNYFLLLPKLPRKGQGKALWMLMCKDNTIIKYRKPVYLA